MSRRDEKTALLADYKAQIDLRDRLDRQYYYKCRNRDNEYSVQDLTLAWFAMETADSLAAHILLMIERCDVKTRADKRYQDRCRLAEVRDQCDKFVEVHTMVSYEDKRELIEEIEELEFKELHWKRHGDGILELEDREAEKRATIVHVRTDNWQHEYLHLGWYEDAAREDIVSGEQQDYKNLRRACKG